MKSVGLQSRLRKKRSALTRANEDGSVTVIDLKNMSECYTIDGLAAKAWILFDGKSTLESISNLLTSDGSSKMEVEMQLKEFVVKLQKLQLINAINP